MIAFPSCKINLGLYILSKRGDGYHDIATCFYPAPWTDILEIIPSQQFTFSASGNIIPGKQEENLCLKAFNLLQKDYGIPAVSIHLHKIIPTGAGLGGGSSDAAWTLRILNEKFNLKLSTSSLENYATRLGSDCAFFIHDKPKLAGGRGEVLNDIGIDLSGKFIIIVKPDVHVSTAEAYAGMVPEKVQLNLSDILLSHSIHEWKTVLKNQFEDSLFGRYPIIRHLKNTLYDHGAIYASMSGSGSAVFGLFDQEVDLKNHFPNTIYWSSTLK